MKRIVFDVESVGLHGEGFAVGFVILEDGRVIASGSCACPLDAARGDASDRKWVQDNVTLPAQHVPRSSPREVREWFWGIWTRYKKDGAELWTDCGWPVEANFLSACIADEPLGRKWEGPYPLHDVALVIKAAGGDPLATNLREPGEEPAHNPLTDARQSARLLLEAEYALAAGPQRKAEGENDGLD